jgi:hypothetical protein
MSKPRRNGQTKEARNPAAGGHDLLIMELVRLLARAAAERDYDRLHRSNARGKTTTLEDG